MLLWIIQISLLSLIFIFLIHHLLVFFKTTLTVPKIKDLVNSPKEKYQNIFDTLSHKSDTNLYTEIDLLPISDSSEINVNANVTNVSNNMKDELKLFLKKQLTSGNAINGSNAINDNDSIVGNNIVGMDTIGSVPYSNLIF